VAERELAVVAEMLNWNAEQLMLRELPVEAGPGNALTVSLEYENLCEVFTGFGEKGVSAESVATRTVRAVRDYLATRVAAGRYLADQLLLPMALAKGGAFTTFAPTAHFDSNCEVIARFTGARIGRTENAGAFLIEIG
jgi:RNA 3'-terminal phosphate cyclase (ATP)